MVWFIQVEKMGSPSYPDHYLKVILTLLGSFPNPNLEVTLTLVGSYSNPYLEATLTRVGSFSNRTLKLNFILIKMTVFFN